MIQVGSPRCPGQPRLDIISLSFGPLRGPPPELRPLRSLILDLVQDNLGQRDLGRLYSLHFPATAAWPHYLCGLPVCAFHSLDLALSSACFLMAANAIVAICTTPYRPSAQAPLHISALGAHTSRTSEVKINI